MEETSLVDRFCPEPHNAPLTAAAYDPRSGTTITADSWGTVAIQFGGESAPGIIFDTGSPVFGAVAVSDGGTLVAVGDESGTIAAYKTDDGSCVFSDHREGEEGQERAMRAICFNPQGTIIATLAADGVIRVYDLQRWEQRASWGGFGGNSIAFDSHGDRILAIDHLGQPKLLDLLSQQSFDLDNISGGAQVARFTPEGNHVVVMGERGITILELPEGHIVNSFKARGSSGMLNLVIDPEGQEVSAVTERSIHRFALPDLDPIGSARHGAPEATDAAIWGPNGPAIGSTDGRLYSGNDTGFLPPVVCVGGFGDHRIAAHGSYLAVWTKNRRKRPFNSKYHFIETKIDRDGRLIIGLPDGDAGVQVFDARTGRHLFDSGPDTIDTPNMEVGGSIIACLLNDGGVRWYDLKSNQVFELPWVTTLALSGSGTWIGALTSKGNVHVIDPTTGRHAIPSPTPPSDAPVTLLSFVNRRPDLLVFDEEGILSVYDLTESVQDEVPATARQVLQLNVDVDRLWGITGGQYAAVRFQDPDTETATIIYVDLEEGEVVNEVQGLLPYAWVDPETGRILQPARGGALLETERDGKEDRLLRTLPGGEWVAFSHRGVLAKSSGAQV